MPLALSQPDRASLEFNSGFARGVLEPLRAETRRAWETAAARFRAEHGRPPESLDEVRTVLESLPAYRADDAWTGLFLQRSWRALHEAMVDNADVIERTLSSVPARGLGELRLDPTLPLPDYYARSEFHLVPGNYHGSHLYAFMNELPQSRVVTRRSWDEVKEFFRRIIPPGDYRRIVDFGCGLGRSTIALKELFPEAHVVGIDFSAPELRYAHWEAERRGLAIDFHQEDAARTSFAPDSVDLVMAYILHHEFPPEEMRRVIAEAFRILRSGGWFLNGDVTPNRYMLPLTRFLLGPRQVEIGAEPYWLEAGDMDLPSEYRTVGFVHIREEAPPDHPHGKHFPYWTLGQKP